MKSKSVFKFLVPMLLVSYSAKAEEKLDCKKIDIEKEMVCCPEKSKEERDKCCPPKKIDANCKKEFTMSSPLTSNDELQTVGSGTSWLPKSTPDYGYMLNTKDVAFMFHGSISPRYTSQNIFNSDKRKGQNFNAPSSFMGMMQTSIFDNDRLTLNAMFSLDPFTVGSPGYPLLFQNGETWRGIPLFDIQHPHDLFSELSLTYSYAFTKKFSMFGYFGLPAEPAFGPTAFMHRPSYFSNPDAPIGHHWQDSTHITFGVGTLGLIYDDFKLDASAFNGNEPDENKLNIDLPKLDSYSVRLTLNPYKNLSVQTSYANVAEDCNKSRIKETTSRLNKLTLSTTYNNLIDDSEKNYTNCSTSIVYGVNKNDQSLEHSALLESELMLWRKNHFYSKLEFVQKNSDELQLPSKETKLYNIFGLTVGASRTILSFSNTIVNLGLQGTLDFPDKDLEASYGKIPFSAQVYLKITPDLMMHNHEHEHEEEACTETKEEHHHH